MPRPVLIHLLPDAALPDGIAVQWRHLDVDGASQTGWPSALDARDRAVVLLPSEWLSLLAAPALPGSRRQREQAVAFALEDQWAAPVESLHCVLSADQAGSSNTVAVIDKARMQTLCDRLASAGIHVDRILPDVALLPAAAASVLLASGRALLRLPDGGALCGSMDELPMWLALPTVQAATAAGIDAYGEWPAQCAQPPGLRVHALDDALAWLAARLDTKSGPNLLQGAFRPQGKQQNQYRLWRWAAALLLAAGLGSLLHAWLDYRALDQQLTTQQAAMTARYKALLPQATRVFDPVNQLRSRLAAGGETNADGLRMLAEVAPSLAAANVLPLFAMDYRDGQWDLTVQAASVSALDAIRQRIAALPDLDAELTAVTPGQGATEGRLRIVRRKADAS